MVWEEFDRPAAERSFRVIRPEELQAEHWFELESAEGGTVVRHTVEGCAVAEYETGLAGAEYETVWRERIEPLHDLILEALLDNVEAAAVFGQTANTGR